MRPIQTTMAFGASVRLARNARGLTQAELAARAHLSRQRLSGLETGERTAELGRALSGSSALDLAVAFVPTPVTGASGIDLGQILGTDS